MLPDSSAGSGPIVRIQAPLLAHFHDLIEPWLRLVVILPTVRNFLTEPTVRNDILDLLLQIGAIVTRSQQPVDSSLHSPVASNFSCGYYEVL